MEIYIILLIIIQYVSFVYNLEYISRKIENSNTKNDYYFYKTLRFLIPTITFLILFTVTYYHDEKLCAYVIFLFILSMFLKLPPMLFIR